jgi:dTDP-4-amino-4,6-dideoxygalactose transaminase
MTRMRVPIYDTRPIHERLLPELEEAFREVLLEGQSDVVPQVTELEREVAATLGGGHAVGVQSGTAALFLILKVLGVGTGDEVVTVPNSDIATTAAISHTGGRFVLCDIEPDTMTLDPERLESCITSRTKAILPVHLYGHPAEMDSILEIARRHELHVVEDAALALGASVRGRPVGLIGAAGAFSFAAYKVIGGVGNGGW